MLAKEQKDFIESLIGVIKMSKNKDMVIEMLEKLIAPSEPLTLADAYDSAYGSALAQVYDQEGWL